MRFISHSQVHKHYDLEDESWLQKNVGWGAAIYVVVIAVNILVVLTSFQNQWCHNKLSDGINI